MITNTASIYEREPAPEPMRRRKAIFSMGADNVRAIYHREAAYVRAQQKPVETSAMGQAAIVAPEPQLSAPVTPINSGELNAEAIRRQVAQESVAANAA